MALTDFQTFQRIITLLQNEDGMDGYASLSKLRAEAPNEVLERVVSLLRFPEEKVRRRAGGALSSFRLAGVDMQPHAAALAEYLELFMAASGHGDEIDKCWGKLDSIIRRARDVAKQAGSDGKLNGT